nr:MAG TPA: hypothetical protein [Caudoviricetes sp.]
MQNCVLIALTPFFCYCIIILSYYDKKVNNFIKKLS